MNDYEDVPYESHAIPYASPQAIALAARREGEVRAPLERIRVLEVGCGDGAHLLPLGFHHPEWELVGVDTSERAIARARAGAEAVGLKNVTFRVEDLARTEVEPASYDYVIAHGVYSWIDAEHREALRHLMRRALRPSGLAYVCFNALPGWGVRGRVRDQLLGLEPSEARERARRLGELAKRSEGPWAAQLVTEFERVRDASEGYLTHEYLAPDNQAFWLREVVSDFEAAGMRYAGDAQAAFREGWVTPELRASIEPVGRDPLERAELIDLLAYRQLRGVVFARDDAPSVPGLAAKVLDEVAISGVLRPMSEVFDLTPGVEEPFSTQAGAEVRIAAGISKMAVLMLGARFPDAFTYAELVELAAEELAERGYRPDLDKAPALREGITQLLDHRMLEARLGRGRLRIEPGERPRATRLARWEAQHAPSLTTPIHVALPLDPVDRRLVTRLDGERDLETIVEALTLDVVEGRVSLEGAPSGAFRIGPLLHERARRLVSTLGWWGVLDPG